MNLVKSSINSSYLRTKVQRMYLLIKNKFIYGRINSLPIVKQRQNARESFGIFYHYNARH